MAGNVQSNTVQLGGAGGPGAWVTTFFWTGDASNGTVPASLAQSMAQVAGYVVTQVEFQPLSPAPTNGYSATLTDQTGFDVLGGAASSLSSTLGQSFAAVAASTPLNGVLTLNIAGQAVASARGRVYVYLQKR